MSKGGKAELLTFFYCLPLHYLVFAVMKLVRGGHHHHHHHCDRRKSNVIIGRAGQTLLFDWRTPHPLVRTRHSGFIGFCFNTISTSVISCQVLQVTFGLSQTAENIQPMDKTFSLTVRDIVL